MKPYPLHALLFVACLSSCSKEDQKTTQASDQQRWQLVKMTGSMIHSETTGKDMSWQEYYLLNSDGTFLKSREQNGQVKEATGTYTYTTLNEEKYIQLTYKSGADLIASCMGVKQQEQLYIVFTDKIVGTWSWCDGPGLEYQLVKEGLED
jgi:hypothetical protein